MENEEIKLLRNIIGNEFDKLFRRPLPDMRLREFEKKYLDYYDQVFSDKYKESIRSSFKQLYEYFGDIDLQVISSEMLQRFLSNKAIKSPSSAASLKRTLKAAFTRARDMGYIFENPFLKVKLKKTQTKLPAFITSEDLQKIVEKETSQTLKKIYQVLFDTGLRAGEITSLKWNEVSLEDSTIQIGSDEFETKTKSIRCVPMTKRVKNILSEQFPKVIRLNNSRAYVFHKSSGHNFTVNYISKRFKKACRAAGMDERIHLHSLRHSFASSLVKEGVDIYKVKTLLGHSSIQTTERYTHLRIDSLKEAVSRLDGSISL